MDDACRCVLRQRARVALGALVAAFALTLTPSAADAASIAATPAGTVAEPSVPPAFPPAAKVRGWDPGDRVGATPWSALQWNFTGRFGVRAPAAWQLLRGTRRQGSRPGGSGVRIAVIDSGIAYRSRGRYVRSPDLLPQQIEQGYDFVDNDRFPDDQSGHGTHVASTIAGATGNGTGLTGLAYNATILPLRVLDDEDNSDATIVTRAIRYATKRKVDIINLSVDLPLSITAPEVPDMIEAIEDARRAGILVIGAAGNEGRPQVALPARSSSMLAVGATTVRGCRARFSNSGPALDLVAPGGGMDHVSERGVRGCDPDAPGAPIAQVTLAEAGKPGQLSVPFDYVGTSMAAAHVTGVAALVRASRILGENPSPELMAAYLVRVTRDRGAAGRDNHYGAGLIDAALAVDRSRNQAAVRGAKRAVAAAKRARRQGLPVR